MRTSIKADLDILDRLPPREVHPHAALWRSIDTRITAVIEGVDRSAALRRAAMSHQGHSRDAVTFVCAVLFSVVWWRVPHHRAHWTQVFTMYNGPRVNAAGCH